MEAAVPVMVLVPDLDVARRPSLTISNVPVFTEMWVVHVLDDALLVLAS